MFYYYQDYIGISPYHTLCHGLLLSGLHWYQSVFHSISCFIIIRISVVSVRITLYVMFYFYHDYIGISPYHTLHHILIVRCVSPIKITLVSAYITHYISFIINHTFRNSMFFYSRIKFDRYLIATILIVTTLLTDVSTNFSSI